MPDNADFGDVPFYVFQAYLKEGLSDFYYPVFARLRGEGLLHLHKGPKLAVDIL
jgi:hypothetical protein